jgi:Leu/Phe-tRNA-protein transferase
VYHFPLITGDDNSFKVIKCEIDTAELNKDSQKKLASLSLFNKGYRINTSDEFMTICSSCKRIKDDKGKWIPIERCMHDLYGPEFSHGICLSCAAKLYPHLFSENDTISSAQT